jgi:predicted outer membrane protein
MRKLMIIAAAMLATTAIVAFGAGGASGAGKGHRSQAKVSGLDEEWTTAALQGDLFEVKGGETAQKQGQNQAVKQLGTMLSSDHAESYALGSKLAKKLGIEVPTEPTYPEKWELQTVGEMSGSAFDKGYTSLERLDHKQDIEDAKTEIEDGSSKAVKALAKMDLKMYREHLSAVVKTEQEL